VREIEAQVERGITEFQSGEGTTIVPILDDDDSGDTVAVHKGIHSGLWDLRSVFEGYLPNLQRRSALITLFSFLESELDRLCNRIRVYEHSALELSDITDKGIVRATNYLIKVGGLPNVRNCKHWQEIRNIQAIRNLIVHSEGLLLSSSGGRRAKILSYIEKNPYLSGTASIFIGAGYLAHTLATFKAFFGELHAQMKCKYECQPGTSK
jgi:hypothetical protein